MEFAHLVMASLIFIFGLLPQKLLAQDAGAGTPQPTGQEVSFTTGPMLPKDFPVSSEIMKTFSMNYGYPMSSNTLVEGGLLFSNSGGASYQDMDFSYRADMPFQDLTIYALGGVDFMRMKNIGSTWSYYGGFHFGGGALAHIVDQTFLRLEMRFNLHPGTLMLFNFGLEFRFGAGGGGS